MAHIRKQMIVFLLRNALITQLHKYTLFMAPDTQNARFLRTLTADQLAILSARIKTQIKQFVNDEAIRVALRWISLDNLAAGLAESDYFLALSTFCALQPFLDGEHHFEAIMFNQQIDRTTLTRVFDIFADVLVVYEAADVAFSDAPSAFPKRRLFT